MKKEEISKFYINYKLYIFPIIIALSSLVLIIFVIYPQTIKLISNQKSAMEVESKSKFLEAKAQTLESLDPVDLNRKVKFALNSYPTDKDFVSAVALLQNLTSQANFNIVSISVGSRSETDQSYNLKVDLLGSTALLPALISSIEKSPRLMKVSTLETTAGKDPKGGIIALSVDVLYAPAPTVFGSVDSPLPELSQKDQEILVKLARVGTSQRDQTPPQSGPRGKTNPFE